MDGSVLARTERDSGYIRRLDSLGVPPPRRGPSLGRVPLRGEPFPTRGRLSSYSTGTPGLSFSFSSTLCPPLFTRPTGRVSLSLSPSVRSSSSTSRRTVSLFPSRTLAYVRVTITSGDLNVLPGERRNRTRKHEIGRRFTPPPTVRDGILTATIGDTRDPYSPSEFGDSTRPDLGGGEGGARGVAPR